MVVRAGVLLASWWVSMRMSEMKARRTCCVPFDEMFGMYVMFFEWMKDGLWALM